VGLKQQNVFSSTTWEFCTGLLDFANGFVDKHMMMNYVM